jgi:hypothetical protein
MRKRHELSDVSWWSASFPIQKLSLDVAFPKPSRYDAHVCLKLTEPLGILF